MRNKKVSEKEKGRRGKGKQFDVNIASVEKEGGGEETGRRRVVLIQFIRRGLPQH